MKKLSKAFIILSLFLTGCGISTSQIPTDKIMSTNIIDRNGMSETISSKERLEAFEKTDFLSPQPYQKVMRVYGREKNGNVRSCITSYHPNGQIKQYLESINNSAFGTYREWFPNGQMKVDALVVSGVADVNTYAEESWLFDNVNRAWDVDGHLLAQIYYNKGELEGESIYYHANGQIWKRVPFKKNALHGTETIFLENGMLFQTTEYENGLNGGPSVRYWEPNKIAYSEEYEKGNLIEAHYYLLNGEEVSEIKNGNGLRSVFGKEDLQELQEYRNGVQEGEVKVFEEGQNLIRIYSLKNGEKHGEETDYFPSSSQPSLLLNWERGVLQGSVKTWYENGNLESQREMSQNKKNGLLTAWYKNGALMLAEEYDNDRLIKGEYYRKGEKEPISKVEKGKGVTSLFNADGNFLRKITYRDGIPNE